MGWEIKKLKNRLLKIYDGKMDKRLEREFNKALEKALEKSTGPEDFAERFEEYLELFGIMVSPEAVNAVEVKLGRNNELEVWLYCAGFDVKITKYNAEILPKIVYVEHD